MTRRLFLLVMSSVAASAPATPPPDRFEATFVSVLPNGGMKRETRPLLAHEIRSIGAFKAADAVAIDIENEVPARPSAPVDGTVPDDLMRVNYHLARNDWMRDTTYVRTSFGGSWQLTSDLLRRGGLHGGGRDDCPREGDNCADRN